MWFLKRKLAFDAQNMGKIEGKITLKYCYIRKREKIALFATPC